MPFVSLGGSDMRPGVSPPRFGPGSRQPGRRVSAYEENRRIEQQAHDRAEASVPILFRAIVWLGVIGLLLMLFDVIPSLSGTLMLVKVWAPMLGIVLCHGLLVLAFALRARCRRRPGDA